MKSNFYELIPIGQGFRDDVNYEMGKAECEVKLDKDSFKQQRDKLMKLFNYSTTRIDGKEKILYPKVNFILNNRFPDDKDNAKEAILMLISDRNILFKDIDREYRHRILNRPDRGQETMDKTEREKLNELTRAYYEDSTETAGRFTSYLKRLGELSDLQAGYEQYEVFGTCPTFGLSEIKMKQFSPNNDAFYDIILKWITSHFETLDKDRRRNEIITVPDEEGAKRRLCWCLECVFSKCISDGLLPITILKIIHCTKRDIIRAEAESILGIEFKQWISKGKQYQERLQQLIFLNGLFCDFNYSAETRQKNLSHYLRVWGVAILSKKEQQLWRQWSESGIKIPAIEFQLLLYDYWKECLPLNLDTLCYSPASRLHLGGFYEIFHSTATADEMEKYSRELETEEPFIKHRDLYLQTMGKPRSLNEKINLLGNMDEIHTDRLMATLKTDRVDTDELRRVLKETILRMSLRRKALKNLSIEVKKLWKIQLLGIE